LRKIVDVFLHDKLVASYPIVVTAFDWPMDDDFVRVAVKQMRRGPYSHEDVKTARFIVRDTLQRRRR
jgi:hypothetical protein